MNLKTLIKNGTKAFTPYGIIVLRKRILNKNQVPNQVKVFKKIFLKNDIPGKQYFDFSGAFMPDISEDTGLMNNLITVFKDTFMFHCLLNDNYDKSIIEALGLYMPEGEGPYGYKDGSFDITVHKDDVVIDAGAWCGDFSAYSASKGATAYAFEPTCSTFTWLEKTAELNKDSGKIIPIKCGLGAECKTIGLFSGDSPEAGSNTVAQQRSQKMKLIENIKVVTLDQFVAEHNLPRIDFIKADIEGAERDMLKGATNVLKKMCPKLAICTYHFPDDPEVLENIILAANPNYKIVHLNKKLFASVV